MTTGAPVGGGSSKGVSQSATPDVSLLRTKSGFGNVELTDATTNPTAGSNASRPWVPTDGNGPSGSEGDKPSILSLPGLPDTNQMRSFASTRRSETVPPATSSA